MNLLNKPKRNFLVVLLLVLCNSLFCDEITEVYDKESNVWYKNNEENGHIMFSGFDFNNYEPETVGLEPMLEKTLKLLKDYYGESKQPFVFVGHSQGGLRALAMSTYLKEKNPELYKQLRGVITISGIDRGLELLEGRGSIFRTKVAEDVKILSDGVIGLGRVLSIIPFSYFLEDIFIKEIFGCSINEKVEAMCKEVLSNGLEETKGFAYPIMYDSGWDEYAQIRDMVPQSDFIKKYVFEETTKTYQHKSKQDSYTEIEWRKKWGWLPYPVVVTKYKPVYVKTKDVNMKVDKDLPLKFLAGTVSDTMQLANDKASDIVDGIDTAVTLFNVGYGIHVAKCCLLIGFLTNSNVYAQDCKNAATWCKNYKSEISDLLGGQIHDGLVTLSHQHLPTWSCVDTLLETKVLNNTELKEYPKQNHENMNGLETRGTIIQDSAKAYANLTVQEWLKD